MINPPQVRPEEPTAVTPHGGICGSKSQQWLSYPTNPHATFCGNRRRVTASGDPVRAWVRDSGGMGGAAYTMGRQKRGMQGCG
jgi:hypothetical protein